MAPSLSDSGAVWRHRRRGRARLRYRQLGWRGVASLRDDRRALPTPARASATGAYRLMYGEADDPHRVLTRLGTRLEAALAPETVLPTIVDTAREALRLPYAAIVLTGAPDVGPAALGGLTRDAQLRVPLTYQQEL